MGELPLDPRSLANYILSVRNHFGFETSNLELQKLAYFCYARFLISHSEKLCEGYFEAWEHGPVHPLIYREFKEFGSKKITKKAESRDIITGETKLVPPPKEPIVTTLVVETILQLRNLNASQLRKKSHARGGPWHSVWESAKINLASQAIIPDSVIREVYKRHILAFDQGFEEETIYEDSPPFRDGSS